jgi:hypothetical protein
MKLNALWAGGDLSYIERLCLTSALRVGHEVDLYTYGPISNVPQGISLKDAREVLPEDLMVRHKTQNSFALGSDIFRLMLQKQGRGCYIDCDVLLLKPIPDEEYVFGWQDTDSINGAVLRLPSDSPIIADILAMITSKPIVPPWWKRRARWRQQRNWLRGKDMPLEKMSWGVIGPVAITFFAQRNGLAPRAKPVEVFYPNHWSKALDIFDPAADIRSRLTEDTVAVHLWHNLIKACRT